MYLRTRVGFLQQGNKEEMHDPRSFPLSTASSVVASLIPRPRPAGEGLVSGYEAKL